MKGSEKKTIRIHVRKNISEKGKESKCCKIYILFKFFHVESMFYLIERMSIFYDKLYLEIIK